MKVSKKVLAIAAGLGLVALVAGSCSVNSAAASATKYSAQNRQYSIVAVPLLVHEQTGTYDYLNKAFAKHGLLDGKEVWGWSTSSLTVYQWDSVAIDIVNPGDDAHTFTISELGVNVPMKPGAQTKANFVAMKVGTYKFFCAMPEHMPYMSGTITVLPDSASS
jgi:hypothetical protein